MRFMVVYDVIFVLRYLSVSGYLNNDGNCLIFIMILEMFKCEIVDVILMIRCDYFALLAKIR